MKYVIVILIFLAISFFFGMVLGIIASDEYDDDEEQEEYKLFLGARDCQSGNALNGCTVYFTSKDLKGFQFGGKLLLHFKITMHQKNCFYFNNSHCNSNNYI